MANILEVSNLSMYYITKAATVRAVEDVSFNIVEGETFGLVGESGCGKSTTARTIMRLIPPVGKIVSGKVMYHGQDVVKMNNHELRQLRGRQIGMIFQDPMTSLNPVTPVSKQFYECLRRDGMTKPQMRERAIELLRLVGIPEPEKRLDNYVHELSGGMRQRVMIAIALASQPKLLLADEPTGALDYQTGKAILKLLQDTCHSTGKTVVLITHNAAFTDIADRVIHIREGRVAGVECNDRPLSADVLEW